MSEWFQVLGMDFRAPLKLPETVVADAVVVEPVSNAKFPANREINRELFQRNRDFRRKNKEFKSPKLKLSPDEVFVTGNLDEIILMQ